MLTIDICRGALTDASNLSLGLLRVACSDNFRDQAHTDLQNYVVAVGPTSRGSKLQGFCWHSHNIAPCI